MEIPISIAAKIAEYTVEPVGQWLCYSFHFSTNIENMKNRVMELKAARDRVQRRVIEATKNAEEIEDDVNMWLTKVDDILVKAEEVLDDEEKPKTSSSKMACPNLKLRHKHSKKAKKIVQEIDELKNCRFDTVSYRSTSKGSVTTTNMDYITFESRRSTVEELMEALVDADINMIGVWGMPGVGKSTLIREVAMKVKEKMLFDEVAIATVTHQPEPSRIQGEIADKLDLKLDKETLSGKADLLRERLTKDTNKKILVILDDIWEKLDLNEIGIPYDGCKIVVTSRNRDILSSEMGAQKDFGLGVLPKEEAWCLFEKLSGDSLKESNLRSKAMEVCIACAGLPLALITVAKALKNKRFFEWEDALRQLRRPSPRNQKRMQEVIYSAIKLSYSYLESEELQLFFLFCAQNQVFSVISYQDLLKKCFGLRLFQGISTLEEARNRTYTLVRSLMDAGLLLDALDSSRCFRMHDLTRDVALLISYETQNVLTMRDEGLVEWPDEDDMKMCTSISVFNRDIHELPDRLECPELRLLHVYAKDREDSFKISSTFFEGMRKLKGLDLTYMRISSLPSSLKLLTNLRTLCLDQCVLGDMAMIGEMKNLEILSLICSEFEQLPREIGLLTHLRMLDLSNCKKLQVIPANVLSCLILLEELYVGNSFTQWDVEGLNNERASLAELKHLSRLSTLEVHIPDANMMPKDLLFKKLKRYKIFIGDVWDWSVKHENSRVLKLKLNTCNQLERGIEMLFNGIEDLCLDELNGVKSIVYELDMKGFQQLKHLHVQNNAEIKYIIHSRGLVIDDVVFPALKIFSLKNMINLEGICDAQLPLTSLRHIRLMKVEHCEKLKFVFSSSIAKGLSQLQELEIKECNIMRAIVVKEDGELEDRDVILFPQLRHLKLQCLPKLMSFLGAQNSIITHVGEIIHEGELDFQEIPHTGMQPLFNEEVAFPNLEALIISHMPNLKIIWHDKFAPGSFTKLRSMKVQFCENLTQTFRVNMLSRFQSLESLVVDDCDLLEEIFEIRGQEVMETRAITITQLKKLFMRRLPKLKRVWNKDPQGTFSFQNLQQIEVGWCESLQSLFPTSVARCLKQLEDLRIVECGIEEIIEQEEGAKEDARFVFPKLTNLMLRNLSKLKWFYRGVHTSEWPLLKTLEVSGSNEIQIFASKNYRIQEQDEQIQLETSIQQPLFLVEEVAFPSLETLTIMHMENLKIIWHDQLAEDSFFKLQILFVKHCENLVNIFESNMLTRFQSLERLEVTYCGSLQEVFELQRHDVRESHSVIAIPLKRLILRCLPKMKQVWNKDPQGIFSFQNLQEISVWECESLQSLFPASVARCLMQLEDLRIADCGVEEIVAREDVAEATARHLFPKVTILYLHKLPKLKWFCRGVHTSEWPLLKDLEVGGCDQIEIFTSKILNFQETIEQSQLETSIQQPLFLVEEGTLFPNLEVLRWGENYKMKEIQCELFEECLYKLKVLRMFNHVAISDWITFLKRLHNLEKLFVKSSSWEEIFPYKELFDMENHATILARLRELELFELPMLTHLWKEDTEPSPMFHNLENLKVSICDKLKILVPSSVSFQNLTILEICKCHGLINLVTSSTAKSLVQLKKMSVSECERITEVVTGERGEASEVITFTQLTYLKLDYLPNLSSFCSISYSFEFPSLEEVIVRQCPEMKTFSHGALGTPKLERVQATQEDEWHWKANLNTTIHWLWESKYNTTTQ
ncbi:hypothetical protein RGQ29_014282 [Quercus rubra]|uniref:AAA+ ATPase domain-containing protein n=1 Tax=Quercus rubra TaxID=3512 RepID=A0AAN7FU08_QUERU|nr:hypothetical protein RGQ29_014282 [Quercus rubra]